MGDETYSQSLDIYEYDAWRKKVLKWMIDKDLTKADLANLTGYSSKTVYDALGAYERCSKFFVAAVNEVMEE